MSLQNFSNVLQDFQNVFRQYAEPPYPDAGVLLTRKFYQIDEWNSDKYARLGRLYDYHVDLVEDLMLELTRATNFVCDEVRATLLSSFRIKEGRISIVSGPSMGSGPHRGLMWEEMVVQYDVTERATTPPYPGLPEFLTVRATRDIHYGRGERPNWEN